MSWSHYADGDIYKAAVTWTAATLSMQHSVDNSTSGSPVNQGGARTITLLATKLQVS